MDQVALLDQAVPNGLKLEGVHFRGLEGLGLFWLVVSAGLFEE